MRRVFLNSFSHITFPFEGSVGNPDSSQFQIPCASSSGFSSNTGHTNVIKHILALKTLATFLSFLGLIITMQPISTTIYKK